MRDHQEIELKWALAEADHRRLRPLLDAAIGSGAALAQENRFFDTADRRLRLARMNLRLRRERHGDRDPRIILTCKHKAGDAGPTLSGGLSAHREWEEELAPDLAARIAAGMHAPDAAWAADLPLPPEVRAALADGTLQALGGFANQRHEYAVTRDGLAELLCLDRTDYAVRVDHELEIETTDPAATAAHWAERLAAWGIPWRAQTLTKFARFIALG